MSSTSAPTALLASMLAVSGTASAQTDSRFQLTTAGLSENCQTALRVEASNFTINNNADNMKFGFCMGWVSGFLEGNERAKKCVPDGSTVGQVVRVFLKWSEANPESLHLPREQGLSKAILQSFGCAQ